MSVDEMVLVDGLRTRIRVQGQGTPLLLLGGVWSQVELWETLLPDLDGFQVIAFDPPGIGATELPAKPYSIRGQAAFAAGVLDAVGVERAHVMGVSLGGAVAQQLARDHAGRVDRLVLVSTAYGIPLVPGRPDVLLRFIRPRAYGDPATLERSAGALFGGRIRTDPTLVRRWHLRPPGSLKAYAWRLIGTTGWSSLCWLSEIQHPTLVVHGDDDPIVPVLNGRVISRRLPAGRLHVVPGGGHLMLLDSADEVLPVITDFLDLPDLVSGPNHESTQGTP
jgi:poly(3-hydroxyalkanoate) depolymerase